jgi:hypothetical protein
VHAIVATFSDPGRWIDIGKPSIGGFIWNFIPETTQPRKDYGE